MCGRPHQLQQPVAVHRGRFAHHRGASRAFKQCLLRWPNSPWRVQHAGNIALLHLQGQLWTAMAVSAPEPCLRAVERARGSHCCAALLTLSHCRIYCFCTRNPALTQLSSRRRCPPLQEPRPSWAAPRLHHICDTVCHFLHEATDAPVVGKDGQGRDIVRLAAMPKTAVVHAQVRAAPARQRPSPLYSTGCGWLGLRRHAGLCRQLLRRVHLETLHSPL